MVPVRPTVSYSHSKSSSSHPRVFSCNHLAASEAIAMAFMTRRPPSLISWNDAEIQLYLQSILMPSLVVDLNNLNLNDLDENDSNSGDANGHDDGDSASMSSHDETLTTSDTSKRTSSEAKIVVSGQKSTSSFMTSVDTKPSFLASSKGMESAHPAPDPNKPSSTSSTTTTTTVQDLPSLQSNGRDRDLSSFNIPPRRVVFAIASGNSGQIPTSQPYKQKGQLVFRARKSYLQVFISLIEEQKRIGMVCRFIQLGNHNFPLRKSHVFRSVPFRI